MRPAFGHLGLLSFAAGSRSRLSKNGNPKLRMAPHRGQTKVLIADHVWDVPPSMQVID